LKNLNQGLLEQIRELKEEKLENLDYKDIDKSDDEKNSCLKNHNQNLPTQIKKINNDRKSLENKLELLIEKEASKFLDEQIQVMENGTITNPIPVTIQRVAKSTKKKTTSDVGVQTMEAPSILTNRNSAINKATSMHEENHISKLNEENATSMIRKNHVIRNPYRHPNHTSKYINQSEYQCHSGWE
jgi:hypothetical protein